MTNLCGRNLQSSAARALSSLHIQAIPDDEISYLEKLLDEEKNITPQSQKFPICNELLKQEILRVTDIISRHSCNDVNSLQFGSLNLSNPLDMMHDVNTISLTSSDGNSGWNSYQHQAFGVQQGPPIDHRNVALARNNSLMTKKILRLDVPVDSFPGFNFVGRLLGPRGNSLKRIEARTGCRVFIRGRGSMKDPRKEEHFRRRPGLAHLKEPLHVLIEAESPANIVDEQLKQAQEIIEELLKPMSKSQDLYKRQQLQEMAMLNYLFPEDASKPSSSASHCRSGALKGTTRLGTM
uniref:KH domain-containing protein SPIN1-like isoform X2 n=1 Tax=Erigeron canadensis TaxID=72917 RepID=UPI001CB8D5A1|nr:KH domain-containing protein SPIN1-like isoform X2 [Erigeron canadensis]